MSPFRVIKIHSPSHFREKGMENWDFRGWDAKGKITTKSGRKQQKTCTRKRFAKNALLRKSFRGAFVANLFRVKSVIEISSSRKFSHFAKKSFFSLSWTRKNFFARQSTKVLSLVNYKITFRGRIHLDSIFLIFFIIIKKRLV